jgi:hypothetical protein
MLTVAEFGEDCLGRKVRRQRRQKMRVDEVLFFSGGRIAFGKRRQRQGREGGDPILR